MSDDDIIQPYRGGGPGRLDVNGVEWWACDPYPTWFRWEKGAGEGGKDVLRTRPAAWVPDDPLMAERKAQQYEARAAELEAQASKLRNQAHNIRNLTEPKETDG